MGKRVNIRREKKRGALDVTPESLNNTSYLHRIAGDPRMRDDTGRRMLNSFKVEVGGFQFQGTSQTESAAGGSQGGTELFTTK